MHKWMFLWLSLSLSLWFLLRVAVPLGIAHAQTTADGANTPVMVTTYADLTGNGAAQRVATTGTCRWIQFAALSSNGTTARFGDSNVSSSRGIPLDPGAEVPFGPIANINFIYRLADVYIWAASNDKVSLTCVIF